MQRDATSAPIRWTRWASPGRRRNLGASAAGEERHNKGVCSLQVRHWIGDVAGDLEAWVSSQCADVTGGFLAAILAGIRNLPAR